MPNPDHKSRLYKLTKIELSNHSKSIPLPRLTLAHVESLTIPLVQKVVVLADFRCKGCQERVADIMSRMSGKTDSVVLSVLEKKVTLTSRYPRLVKIRKRQFDENCETANKFSQIMRLFRSSCR